LLTLDMPISKSTLQLHHSPVFRLTPSPGSFRVAPFEAPISPVLRSAGSRPAEGKVITTEATQEAVSRLQQSARPSRPARNLPIRVAFPHFGPSIFLVSELTSENQTPVLEIDIQREKKRGER
jgi:hypothetical protein